MLIIGNVIISIGLCVLGHKKIHKKSIYQNEFIFGMKFYKVIVNTCLQDERIPKKFITQK